MPTTPPLPESEVRDLVRRVVEGTLAASVGGATATSSGGTERASGGTATARATGTDPERSAGNGGDNTAGNGGDNTAGNGGDNTAGNGGENTAGNGGDNNTRIAIGADHGGFKLKEELAVKLGVAQHEVVDCGTDSAEPVDYPEIAHAVARKVADGSCQWGIIIDGAGIGSAMAANKVPGIRAALCYDLSTARNSREHNHANVLTLGAGLVGAGLAWQIVQEWLAVPWGPERHARRVAMIDDIEKSYARGAS